VGDRLQYLVINSHLTPKSSGMLHHVQ